MTPRARVERGSAELEERTRQLLDANRELEAITRIVSHDLRAPMRHADGFAVLLAKHLEERPGALDDKGRHYLGRIIDASRHMGSLIDDLVAYARLGQREKQRTPVDLDRMLACLRKEFPSGPAWDLGALGKVKGDSFQLHLAFQHLLANAEKFGKPVPEQRIEVHRAGTRGGRTIFEVADNGVGFDPAYADQLFGIFQRLHPREEFPGNGIGLAIVARAIHDHGGEVWAESRPGAGASFFLTLEAVEEGP